MSTVSDNVLFQSETTRKYDIPLTHLDYPYIEKCTDTKELERILRILRSGDEGFYPDLETFCEERIEKLNPKSRVLRKEVPLGRPGDLAKDEWKKIDTDLKTWEMDMKTTESSKKRYTDSFDDPELPPIRSGFMNGTSNQSNEADAGKKSKRVTPRDYKEWDKFDIDKELNDVDKKDKKEEKKPTKSSTVVPQIDTNINTAGMTDEEKIMRAGKEKDKGNEAFRAGDYEESIAYYTRSIKLHSTAASYNNRAIAHLKISGWTNAAEDCNRVLDLEPDNIKALLRRGTAYKGIKEFSKSLQDYKQVLKLEPENKRAQDLIEDLAIEEGKHEEEKRKRKEKGRRMVIEEVDEESDDEIVVDKTPKEGQKIVNGHSDGGQKPKTPEIIKEKSDNKKPVDSEKSIKSESKQDVNRHGKVVENEHNKNKESTSLKNNDKNIWKEEDIVETSAVSETNKSQNESRLPKNTRQGSNTQTENKLDFPLTQTESTADSSESKSEMGETKEKEKGKESSNSGQNSNSETVKTEETNGHVNTERPKFVQGPLSKGVAELRESGNTFFRAGQYGDAILKYNVAIQKMEKEKTDQRVNISLIYSNRAACYLKTGDCPHAIRDCTTALDLVPHSIKPLLRRANAYEILERYRPAYADYKHVLSIDSSVDMALQGSARCSKHLIEVDGSKWREKLPRVSSVQSWEIPEIIDSSVPVTASSQPIKTSVTSSASSQPINNSVPSSSQSVKTTEKVKDKSQEEKFEEFKTEGNSYVQKGEYQKAVPCYTKCIEILPKKVVSFTNRSLCYLKLQKPTEAEIDCTTALSLDKDNVKALFRRAQARKMLKTHKASLEDLNQLLKVDPKNTAAKKEMDLVKALWREELNSLKKEMGKPAENKPRKRIVIEETDSESEEEVSKDQPKVSKSTSSSTKVDTKVEKQPDKQGSSSKQEQKKPQETKSQGTKTDSEILKEKQTEKKSTLPSSGTKSSTIKPTSFGLPQSVPKLEKATPYEFITAWNSLKQSTDLQPYADLLRQIPPKELPKVISNKLDGAMLSKIAKCVAEKFTGEDDLSTSYQILMNVSKVPRFETIAMFMSKEEKKDIETVLKKVESAGDMARKEDISQLRKKCSL
ncbi:sperm-associated antigen 1 [Mytilus galloprovincialis]|uniref:Sperm-associated antigen 1 n=2 Tax=Mytilus galloprovincialis TaxID=29158 RepID=A0A8B6DFC3_MYTGA|nr:sperm-associated antigen 1 [Mytilus galloprovincialis]